MISLNKPGESTITRAFIHGYQVKRRLRAHKMDNKMAMELSRQAYELCHALDAPGLRAFLEAHSDIDLPA
jgi:hypothetical protein